MVCTGYWALFGLLLIWDTGREIGFSTYTDRAYHVFFNNLLYNRSDPTPLSSHSFASRNYSPGQLFTRKLGGAMILAQAFTKLGLVFSTPTTSPVLWYNFHSVTLLSSILSNLFLLTFLNHAFTNYGTTEVEPVIKFQCSVLFLEAAVMAAPFIKYVGGNMTVRDFKFWSKPVAYTVPINPSTVSSTVSSPPVVGIPDNAFSSYTVTGIVFLCSTLISVPFLRDLFYPGTLMPWFPGDVSYCIFTRAYVHSPGGEAVEEYRGDRLSSQLTALLVLSFFIYKYLTVLLIPRGSPHSTNKYLLMYAGMVEEEGVEEENPTPEGICKSTNCWRLQSLGCLAMWSQVWRFYHVAQETEQYNLGHALMIVFFETFVILTYGWL